MLVEYNQTGTNGWHSRRGVPIPAPQGTWPVRLPGTQLRARLKKERTTWQVWHASCSAQAHCSERCSTALLEAHPGLGQLWSPQSTRCTRCCLLRHVLDPCSTAPRFSSLHSTADAQSLCRTLASRMCERYKLLLVQAHVVAPAHGAHPARRSTTSFVRASMSTPTSTLLKVAGWLSPLDTQAIHISQCRSCSVQRRLKVAVVPGIRYHACGCVPVSYAPCTR